MKEYKEKYKGKEIVFDQDKAEDPLFVGDIGLTVDEKDVHVIKMDDGQFAAHFLPYVNYSSLVELAHNVIDKVPEFSGRLIAGKK